MNTSTTIGLYDFLNMVVMGFLILFPVTSSHNEIRFFVLCFITGLIYHKLMENTFGVCLRNKDGMISQAYKSVNNKEYNECSSKENYYKAYYFLMEKRQLGSIPILEAQAAFLRNILPIPIYYYCNYDKLSMTPEKKETIVFFAIFFVIYVIIWFLDKVIKKFWNTIKINRKGVGVFLSLLPILLSVVLTLCAFSKYKSIQFNCKILFLVIFFTIIIIPFLWYKTQMKIHKLVWEGKSILDKKRKKNKKE